MLGCAPRPGREAVAALPDLRPKENRCPPAAPVTSAALVALLAALLAGCGGSSSSATSSSGKLNVVAAEDFWG